MLGVLPALMPAPALAEPLLTSAMAVGLQRHNAGTFYVGGTIKGHGDVRLLVDTGSSFLVINQEMLADLKLSGDAVYERDLNGAMADGSRRVIPVYRLSGLRIGDNCWIPDVEAAVFPGTTRPILGMNVLARLAPFTFSAEPPQLSVHQCQTAQNGTDVTAANEVDPNVGPAVALTQGE